MSWSQTHVINNVGFSHVPGATSKSVDHAILDTASLVFFELGDWTLPILTAMPQLAA